MADVKKIISALNSIARAKYQGPASSRPTMARLSFDRLQASAKQVADILTANNAPSRDSQENISSQFAAMQKGVKSYCTKTTGSERILTSFNKASVEWALLVSEG